MNKEMSITYKERYVAFLGVLGFKNIVKSTDGEKRISEYLSAVEEGLNEISGTSDRIEHIVISDSIILSIEERDNQPKEYTSLLSLCRAVQHIQYKLARINIWLRGAISKGPAYFSAEDGQVIGPAYTNAYLLQEHSAIYPRVILDNKIVNQLNLSTAQDLVSKMGHKGPGKNNSLSAISNVLFCWSDESLRIRLAKDTPLFINYLVLAFGSKEALNAIVGNIEHTIYQDNTIYSKFRWVADYLLSFEKCESELIPAEEIHKTMSKLKEL